MVLLRASSVSSLTLALLAIAGSLSSVALAATRSWDGGGGTDTNFTNDANWSSNIEPGASDTAEFDRGLGFVYTVTFPFMIFGGDITTDRLNVGSNTVTFANDRSNTNYLVTEPATDELGRGVIIGEEANDTTASLISHLGLLSTAAATLGHVAGSSGTLTLNQNNDQFNVTGSSANTELIIGRFGAGVLNVSGGADVNVTNGLGDVVLGDYAGSSGTASISSAGSTLNIARSLVVGGVGDGTLNINTGGDVASATGFLGFSSAGDGHVTVTGAGSTWSIATSLVVGRLGNGTLNVSSDGDVVSIRGILGDLGSGDGSVTVTGPGSRWNNSENVYVGGQETADGGDGTLAITNEGVVDIGGTLKLWPGGNVALDGGRLHTQTLLLAGGTFNLTSGNLVTQTLQIDSGTFNWTAGTLRLGSDLSIEPSGLLGGSLIVGAGKGLTVEGDLYVGNASAGTLDVIDGGLVTYGDTEGDSHIGHGGEVTVAGGGEWRNDILNVGDGGNGLLQINAGGQVLANQIKIGFELGSTGLVIVDGDAFIRTGAPTNTSGEEIIIGGLGSGALEFRNGGKLDAFGTDYGRILINATGSLIVDGMDSQCSALQLTSNGNVDVTAGGKISSGMMPSIVAPAGQVGIDGMGSFWDSPGGILVDGTLTVSNGGTAQASNISVGALGEIHGDGNIVGNMENNGVVSPGMSSGVLNVDGDYTQTANGELLIELASALSYDQLLVTGEATFAGMLTVNLLDGFVPSPGQSFTILTADEVDGTFTTEMLPSMPGLIFDLVYNPQSVVLTVSPAFTADFDEDGDVDGEDLAQWQGDFGANALSDADDDGDSDGADFLAWQRQLNSVPAVAATAAVPEPGALAMCVSAIFVGGSGVQGRRRRRMARGG